MDKLDESIKRAKQTVEPSADFIDLTMQRIVGLKPKRNWSAKLWAPLLAGGLVAAALVFFILPSSNITKNNAPSSDMTSQTATALPAGTDNASLSSDLNMISNQINQENADQKDANAAINDSSQVITVPTD